MLIIKNETRSVKNTEISLYEVISKPTLFIIIYDKVTSIAPSGHGKPIKKSLLFEVLKRASLNKTETKYNDAIITPNSSQEFIRKLTSFRNHWYKNTDGATPN